MCKNPNGFSARFPGAEEELQAAGQLVIFYSKFHYELNFVENFWCTAKWHARENCEHNFVNLR